MEEGVRPRRIRLVQLRKYYPNSRCRPSSCLLAVLAMLLAMTWLSSYSWNEWNGCHFCFHNQNNSTSCPGLLDERCVSTSGLDGLYNWVPPPLPWAYQNHCFKFLTLWMFPKTNQMKIINSLLMAFYIITSLIKCSATWQSLEHFMQLYM